jgi:hypothetical protein
MAGWAPVVTAIGAIAAAFLGYLVNSAVNRRTERAKRYAEALETIERYCQLPLMFYRLHDSSPETRARLATMLGDVQVAIAFHRRFLEIDSPHVGKAYNELADKISKQNFIYRIDALMSPPPKNDTDIEVPRGAYPFDKAVELRRCVQIMRRELYLRWLPRRWLPD